MASELRVNTLKDASGNNSVAMSTVAEGSAKHFCIFNGTGTIAVDNSFNNASLTDVATGQYTVAVTNAFSSIHYAVTGATLGNNEAFNYCATGGGGYEKTSSTANVKLFQYDGSVLDTDTVDLVSHGDLA
tara:strand:- start:7034 stop:7423 length:390 start_codon:yes stop_codon:yes gene_type:complete